MGAHAGCTSICASSSVWVVDTCHYVDFLMCDTRVLEQNASYHLEASTSGHGYKAVEVSKSLLAEEVLRVINGKVRVLMV